mmetsp:Transcript_35105/g.57353  ORF Transcript_35105/g.57353 Transcript_35105/m.57353 type:complete len:194 (-) Transcript_35105:63-644(-)
MGGVCRGQLPMKEEDLAQLEQHSFLKRGEILKLYKFWRRLGGHYYEEPRIVLSNRLIESLTNLEVNPWAARICFIFASERDALSGLCSLTFDDFVTMVSVFHFRTPIELKYLWAFKLYDFDNDGILGLSDVSQCVRFIVGPTMSDKEIREISQRLFLETDMNNDQSITAAEFANVMHKLGTMFGSKFSIKMVI